MSELCLQITPGAFRHPNSMRFLTIHPAPQRSPILYNTGRHPAGIRALGKSFQSHSSNQCVSHQRDAYDHGLSEGGDVN